MNMLKLYNDLNPEKHQPSKLNFFVKTIWPRNLVDSSIKSTCQIDTAFKPLMVSTFYQDLSLVTYLWNWITDLVV